MKVKDLISELSSFDPEAEILIAYDYPYEFNEPDFELVEEDVFSTRGDFLPKGSYVHKS